MLSDDGSRQSPAWQRAFARWNHAALLTGDLLADVHQVNRTARAFGVRATSKSVREIAERALEVDDEETRALAAQLLAELDRIPVLRP